MKTVPDIFSASTQLEAARRDPAAQAWQDDRHRYRPSWKVSTAPVCPYCSQSLGERKIPSRRSKLTCMNCGFAIWVDPWHQIFPSVYLNARQGLIAKYLGILDQGDATAGRTEDFWWAAQQKSWTKGKSTLTDDEAGDVLWTLMNYNISNMHKINPSLATQNFRFFAEELQRVMHEYRDQEKVARAEMKHAGKVKDGGRKRIPTVPLICPYCNKDLGTARKPMRRSKRACKACGRTIYVEPTQELYTSPFLTERQQYLSGVLGQLDRWVFTREKTEDFNTVKKKLNKAEPLSEDDIADVIRAMIVENLKRAKEQAEEEYKSYKKMTSDIDREFRDAGINWPSPVSGPDTTLPRMVESLLEEFDREYPRLCAQA